jgi:hypothetical protein
MALAGTAGRRPGAGLALIGVALIALNPLALAAHGAWDADYGFVAVVLAQGVLWALAARWIRHNGGGEGALLAIVVGVAVVLRLSVLFETPLHSTDVFRYAWDGRVQGAAVNPYRHVPADPALSHLRDEAVYPFINRAEYAVTVYPPAAQIAFWLFTRVDDRVWAIKLGWLLLEAAAMLVLVAVLKRAGRAPPELLLYAWHPLPVWEIACDGHVDAGMAAFLVFALGAWAARRHWLTGALLAASVLFKPLTLAALPAFWRPWDRRVPAAFAIAAVLAYLPYLETGVGAVGFLPAYLGEEGIGSGDAFILLQLLSRLFGPLPAWAAAFYLALGALALIVLAIACVREPRRDAETTARQAQVLLLVFLLVLSPNYAWYFLVLVPLGSIAPWTPARVLTLLGIVLHGAGPVDGYPRTVLIHALLYGFVMSSLLWDLYIRRNRRLQMLKPGPER